MTALTVHSTRKLHGESSVPGDKSISHRVLILGALAQGRSTVRGWLQAGDTLATLNAMRALGIDVHQDGGSLSFEGGTLRPPAAPIDCVNAGTAIRLLAGLLAGQGFDCVLDGSAQLRRRPMRRVSEPLRAMGARIEDAEGHAPLHIRPAALAGTRVELPVASAQVKSALILAGLHASGVTEVVEPGPSRDHTERMLGAMGADIRLSNSHVRVVGHKDQPLQPLDVTIPGDLSSAAFLIVAAACLPGSDIHIQGVNLNPTRTGLVEILKRMGADIGVEQTGAESVEPVGVIDVHGGVLRSTRVAGDEVVRAIDELPVLAVAATQAQGDTTIADASELRVKEVDRISLLAGELRKLGADIQEQPDGMIVHGPTSLRGAVVASHGDHRLGMALAVAGLMAEGETVVEDADCIGDSFPGFAATFARLGGELQ
jgi:3-phosphoshikimate 1-carboxyvinyltransferase